LIVYFSPYSRFFLFYKDNKVLRKNKKTEPSVMERLSFN
jgi:hypothetical protein